MRDIALIGERLELKDIADFGLSNIYRQYDVDSTRKCIEFTKEDYVFCDFYDYASTLEEYEIGENLDEFISTIPFKRPQIIAILYKDFEVLKKFISSLDFSKELYVDDDWGNIIPLSEYKKSLLAGNYIEGKPK